MSSGSKVIIDFSFELASAEVWAGQCLDTICCRIRITLVVRNLWKKSELNYRLSKVKELNLWFSKVWMSEDIVHFGPDLLDLSWHLFFHFFSFFFISFIKQYYSQPDLAWLSLAGSGFGNYINILENFHNIVRLKS